MNKRIDTIFTQCKTEKRAAVIVYTTVGFPTMQESEVLIDGLIKKGADIIELGVPFSDPMADGVVIQKTSQIALENGATLKKVLTLAKNIRSKHPHTPLILFSYYNVLFNYGIEQLANDLSLIDIDGVLCVDLPFEERDELLPVLEQYGIDFIPLLSPATSLDRAKKIMAPCKGFAYYITVRGVTGTRSELPKSLFTELDAMRQIAPIPLAAGFGISDGKMAQQIAVHADAVVIGSAMVKRHHQEGIESALELIAEIALNVKK